MSGKFDIFCINSGLVKQEDVNERYKIRLCRDRTITITCGKQKPFNKVAIAVISVPTKKEAESLVSFVGKLQWHEHPETGKPWYKFMPNMEYGLLEMEDLPRLAGLLKESLARIRSVKET